jgi:hypothetical protein
MSENKLYQVRIKVSEKFSEHIRSGKRTKPTSMIFEIAKKHGVSPICTLNAFYGYCKEAEDNGISKYPLYHWTKSVIDNPVKREKHIKSFAFYRGSEQVYEKQLADKLHSELDNVVTRFESR